MWAHEVAASPFVHFYMQFKAVSFAPKKDGQRAVQKIKQWGIESDV